MNADIQYLKYVLKHKYYVYKAGRMLNCPIWRLISHDLSKFLPLEWKAYKNYFYVPEKKDRHKFNLAWLRHQHINKHHWQYWRLKEDDGQDIYLEMPREYVLEMLADWLGAGKAITGRWNNFVGWFEKNKEKIQLHKETRKLLYALISDSKFKNFMERED